MNGYSLINICENESDQTLRFIICHNLHFEENSTWITHGHKFSILCVSRKEYLTILILHVVAFLFHLVWKTFSAWLIFSRS